MRRIGLAALLVVLAACQSTSLPQEDRVWYIERDDHGQWMSCWMDISGQISAMACEPIPHGKQYRANEAKKGASK